MRIYIEAHQRAAAKNRTYSLMNTRLRWLAHCLRSFLLRRLPRLLRHYITFRGVVVFGYGGGGCTIECTTCSRCYIYNKE